MEENHARAGFSEAAIWAMLAPIVETKPKFIGGSKGSFILVDFSNFKGECLEHETTIPFFEILNLAKCSNYEHRIEGKRIRIGSEKKAISYYSNSLGYSFRSAELMNGYLLGINPALFQKASLKYKAAKLGSIRYQQSLRNSQLQSTMEYIVNCIVRSPDEPLNDLVQLHIDCQALALLDIFFYDQIRQEVESYTEIYLKEIARVVEWIDTQIELNAKIGLEEILEVAAVEPNFRDFLKAFKRATGKSIAVYCRDRRLEIFDKIQFSKFVKPLSPENLKNVFKFIHKQVLSHGTYDEDYREETKIIEEIASQLDCNLKYLKNACSSMSLPLYSYYRQQCLESAKHLLVTTNYEIKEIAELTGYCEDSLRKALKKNCGYSPGQFRHKFR